LGNGRRAADKILVAVARRVPGLARQLCNRWLRRPATEAEITEAYRVNTLFDAHRDDAESGHRFLTGEAETAGERMSERTAWRNCRGNAWWSAFRRKRSEPGKRSGAPVHEDLVRRDFTVSAVNELWLTDITEHITGRASCTCARSKTPSPAGSSATPSAGGCRHSSR
jgi:putative transposase